MNIPYNIFPFTSISQLPTSDNMTLSWEIQKTILFLLGKQLFRMTFIKKKMVSGFFAVVEGTILIQFSDNSP